MSTRGLYGLRKNGQDKFIYNHFDSYPEGLGRDFMKFVSMLSPDALNRFYDLLTPVDENSTPTKEMIELCDRNGWSDYNVSEKSNKDWYCLTRNLQGNFAEYAKAILNNEKIPFIQYDSFIKDSLFCEYAYIVNLDTDRLEFWEGFQKEPDETNRYGTEPDKDGYYPCKMYTWVFTGFDFDDIETVLNDVKEMVYGNEEE